MILRRWASRFTASAGVSFRSAGRRLCIPKSNENDEKSSSARISRGVGKGLHEIISYLSLGVYGSKDKPSSKWLASALHRVNSIPNSWLIQKLKEKLYYYKGRCIVVLNNCRFCNLQMRSSSTRA